MTDGHRDPRQAADEQAEKIPDGVLRRQDEEADQIWRTDLERYELYTDDEAGSVIIEHYALTDHWFHVETVNKHIVQITEADQ